jgi:hypothetical protein
MCEEERERERKGDGETSFRRIAFKRRNDAADASR